jgi:hypothetical protein
MKDSETGRSPFSLTKKRQRLVLFMRLPSTGNPASVNSAKNIRSILLSCRVRHHRENEGKSRLATLEPKICSDFSIARWQTPC